MKKQEKGIISLVLVLVSVLVLHFFGARVVYAQEIDNNLFEEVPIAAEGNEGALFEGPQEGSEENNIQDTFSEIPEHVGQTPQDTEDVGSLNQTLKYRYDDGGNSLIFEVNYLPSERNFIVEFKLKDSVILKGCSIMDRNENEIEAGGVKENIQLLLKDETGIKLYTMNEVNELGKEEGILINKGTVVLLKGELTDIDIQVLDTMVGDVIMKIKFIGEGITNIAPFKEGILTKADELIVEYLFDYVMEGEGNINTSIEKKIKEKETGFEDLFIGLLFLLLGLGLWYINSNGNINKEKI